MGRTPKDRQPSELDRAIAVIEAKIDSLQLALAALLDVKDPYRPPAGRAQIERPQLVQPDQQTATETPKRSHRRKAADAPKEQPADDLGL